MVPYMVCPVELNSEFLSQIIHQKAEIKPLFTVPQCEPQEIFQPYPIDVSYKTFLVFFNFFVKLSKIYFGYFFL